MTMRGDRRGGRSKEMTEVEKLKRDQKKTVSKKNREKTAVREGKKRPLGVLPSQHLFL